MIAHRRTYAADTAAAAAGQSRRADVWDALCIAVVADKCDDGHRALNGLKAIMWIFASAYRQALADLQGNTYGGRLNRRSAPQS